jgi:hypothetical protein
MTKEGGCQNGAPPSALPPASPTGRLQQLGNVAQVPHYQLFRLEVSLTKVGALAERPAPRKEVADRVVS